MFRMAMIKLAVVRIIINSSYVLIRHHPFPQDSERDGSTSPGCPGKYIILSRYGLCGGAGAVFSFDKLFPTLYNILNKRTESWVKSSCRKSNLLKVAPYLTRTRALLFVLCKSNNKSNDRTKHCYKSE